MTKLELNSQDGPVYREFTRRLTPFTSEASLVTLVAFRNEKLHDVFDRDLAIFREEEKLPIPGMDIGFEVGLGEMIAHLSQYPILAVSFIQILSPDEKERLLAERQLYELEMDLVAVENYKNDSPDTWVSLDDL